MSRAHTGWENVFSYQQTHVERTHHSQGLGKNIQVGLAL